MTIYWHLKCELQEVKNKIKHKYPFYVTCIKRNKVENNLLWFVDKKLIDLYTINLVNPPTSL